MTSEIIKLLENADINKRTIHFISTLDEKKQKFFIGNMVNYYREKSYKNERKIWDEIEKIIERW